MKEALLFDHTMPDYRLNYPAEQASSMASRGGVFPLGIATEDIKIIEDRVNEGHALLTGNKLFGFSVMYQRDARSAQSEAVRDEVIHQWGMSAGFDVDGETSNNEEPISIKLAESDKQALGIETDEPVFAIVRSVYFGSIATKRDYRVSEIEIPTHEPIVEADGTVRQRHLRILKLIKKVPEPVAEQE